MLLGLLAQFHTSGLCIIFKINFEKNIGFAFYINNQKRLRTNEDGLSNQSLAVEQEIVLYLTHTQSFLSLKRVPLSHFKRKNDKRKNCDLCTYLLNPLRSLWSIGLSPHHAIYNGPWPWPWLHPKTFLFFAALCLGFCAKCLWVFLFAWCLEDSSLGLVWLYWAVVFAGCVQSISISSVRWSL